MKKNQNNFKMIVII